MPHCQQDKLAWAHLDDGGMWRVLNARGDANAFYDAVS